VAVIASTLKPLRRDLARVDLLLSLGLDQGQGSPRRGPAATAASREDPGCELPELQRVTTLFGLSSFERDVLLLALSTEIDDRYARSFALLNGDTSLRRPTIGLAVRLLCDVLGGGHELALSSLSPGCRLHRHGLVEIVGTGPHATRELRIPASFWPRLAGIAGTPPFPVRASRAGALAALVIGAETATAIRGALAWARQAAPAPILLALAGAEGHGRSSLAHALAHELGLATLEVTGAQLERDEVARDLVRESAWHRAAVVVLDGAPEAAVARACAEIAAPLILLGPLPSEVPRPSLEIAIAAPDTEAREQLWARTLELQPHDPEIDPVDLGARYRFGPGRVTAAVGRARAAAAARGEPIALADLRDACRAVGGVALGSLARRLACTYEISDLVLPLPTRREIDLVLAWARHGAHVFRPGGAGARAHAHEGLVCLFAGPSGTGKTMAAQVIGRMLEVELWRIDLSQVVNKYIGETEKNLDRVFADAEAAGAMLFFDEADALFGRRTEVKDAHDRYANVETGFLLQRLEVHRGIVVLASNLKRNLDDAFLRRIHVVADFAMPGPDERTQIWQRHLVADRLGPDVDLAQLGARFPLAGGDIRNAVIAAVLLAAEEGGPIAMRHLILGVIRELMKGGRMVSPDDFGPWREIALQYASQSRPARGAK
jgi:ATPase family protein associated with various cellular activities (AAA)/winged helix domain-containing protein